MSRKTKKNFLLGLAIIAGLAIGSCLAIAGMEVYNECTEHHSVGYCLMVLAK